MVSRPRSLFVVVPLAGMLLVTAARAATLPTGFSESLIASGLASPTAMQFAPDGRLFVCEQTGAVRVIKGTELLETPFVTLNVDSQGERGLLGIAFDPSFASNGYVYVYYTMTTTPRRNRISRFTANGDVATAGSELVLMELENLNATNHNGGALNFGADGKLYIAVGDNAVGSNAQTLSNRLGKILRINTDAPNSIPTDNPFYSTAAGVNRAIWALGLRNPFTFAFDSSGSRMFINDVGQNTWEEINDGLPGRNYGWPNFEGPESDPSYEPPLYAYDHANPPPDPSGCAITGGAFYTPASMQFPSDYANDYFFADYCGDWIKRLDPATGVVTDFAGGLSAPVDLKVTDDGGLYYLARGSGSVYRVTYTGPLAPTITTHPASQTVTAGAPVTFRVVANGAAPLQYRWQRNEVDIAGTAGAGSSYTINTTTLQDTGARFRAHVTNGAGDAFSDTATLTVAAPGNAPPTATITQPATGALYNGGSVITYAGTGTDPQDGTLPASAFTWRIDFHHDSHTHPFLPATTGAAGGTVTIPVAGETSANVWYRIHLTVRDSGGLTHTVQRDIAPRKVRLTLNTSPAGLQVRLDGQPTATPLSFDAVVGIVRNLGAQEPQVLNGTTYELVSWSDGGAAAHDISPSANATYTATYRAVAAGPGSPPPPTLSAYTNGLSLSLWWTPVAGATSYRLEAGTERNAKNLVDADVGPATSLHQIAPRGIYYARIRSVGPGGTSGPSNEVEITLDGTGPCATPPPAPTGYNVQVSDRTVALSWNRSPSATSYVLEAGTAPGLADVFNANVGGAFSLRAIAPAGQFFTRLRAINACGSSEPSAEVPITIGCSSPPPAPSLTITNAGGIVTLSWTASAGAALYGAQVGTGPGLSNVFSSRLGSTTSLTVDARGVTGTFFVRVFAASACGVSPASNEASVSIP